MKDKNGIEIKEGDLVLVFEEDIVKYQKGELLTKYDTYYENMDADDLEIVGDMTSNSEMFLNLNEKETERLKRIKVLKTAVEAAVK